MANLSRADFANQHDPLITCAAAVACNACIQRPIRHLSVPARPGSSLSPDKVLQVCFRTLDNKAIHRGILMGQSMSGVKKASCGDCVAWVANVACTFGAPQGSRRAKHRGKTGFEWVEQSRPAGTFLEGFPFRTDQPVLLTAGIHGQS